LWGRVLNVSQLEEETGGARVTTFSVKSPEGDRLNYRGEKVQKKRGAAFQFREARRITRIIPGVTGDKRIG